MTTPMTRMPQAPTRLDMDNFAARGDALMTALPDMVDQFNERLPVIDAAVAAAAPTMSAAAAAAASAATALAAPGTNATSTTSLTIGAGTVSMTVQTGKSFVPGAWLNVSRTSDVTKRMLGQVVSYTAGSGALVLTVAAADINGSGTFADWTLSQSSVCGSVFNAIDLSTLGPSVRPTLLCDFGNAKRLDGRFTCTMAIPLSYYDAQGIMRYAAANQIVVDHHPATRACRGVPFFQASTNLALYSEQFDNAAWIKLQSTVVPNAATAPDGNLTMNKIVEDTTVANRHSVRQDFPGLTPGWMRYSFFAMRAERSRLTIGSHDGSTGFDVVFNLATGMIDATNGASVNGVYWMDYVGNGIYRCHVIRTIVGTTLQVTAYLDNGVAGDESINYTGDGVSGLYLWGATVGTGDIDGPYIPTTSTPVTRAASMLTMPTSAFPYNANAGTLHAEYIVERSSAIISSPTPVLFAGAAGYDIGISSYNSSGLTAASVDNYNVGQANLTSIVMPYGTLVKSALAYAPNDFAFSVNGNAPVVDSSGTVPTVAQLRVGTGFAILNGWVRKVAYYPRRLSNAELTAMTTL